MSYPSVRAMHSQDRFKRLSGEAKMKKKLGITVTKIRSLPERSGSVYKSETNTHPIYRDEGTI